MNYQAIYDQIIERSKTRTLDTYTEKHHIVPKCMGGTNFKSNIAILTAREHFIAHWLLYRIYPDNKSISHAFWMMSCRFKNFSSIAYEEAKLAFREARKDFKLSEESIEKIRIKRKAQGNFWKGKHHTEEGKLNISIGRKDENRTVNPETEALRCSRISKTHLGKEKSDSHKENIRLSKIGANNPQFGKPHRRKICEKCGYNTSINNWSKHKC